MTKSEWSGWAQAVGSFGAIVGTAWVARWTFMRQIEKERQERYEVDQQAAIALVSLLGLVNRATYQHQLFLREDLLEVDFPVAPRRAMAVSSHMPVPVRNQYEFLMRSKGALLAHDIADLSAKIAQTVEVIGKQIEFIEKHVDPKVEFRTDHINGSTPQRHDLPQLAGPYAFDGARSKYDEVRMSVTIVNELFRNLRPKLLGHLKREYHGPAYSEFWPERGFLKIEVKDVVRNKDYTIVGNYQGRGAMFEWSLLALGDGRRLFHEDTYRLPSTDLDAAYTATMKLARELHDLLIKDGMPSTTEALAAMLPRPLDS